MSIQICEEKRLFLISTENMSYGMEVTSAGALVNLHWGPRLGGAEDLPAGEQLRFDGCQEPDKKPLTNQEYPGAGGYFYDEPCLKAMFDNGCRDVKLFYKEHSVQRGDGCETLTIVLREELYPLTVRLCYRIYDGQDVLDRWAELENVGDAPIHLESVQSAVCYPPRARQYRLTHMSGKWACEYNLERTALTQCRTVLESRHGISGPDSCPWFALDENACEDRGEVWAGSVHWSGNWKITAELDRWKQPRITLGLNDYDFGWKLRPGETFAAPVTTLVYSDGGFGGASRCFHRYHRSKMPQSKANALRPVSYNAWCAFEFNINEAQQMKLAERAASLGVELFIMDDGWFGARDNDRAGLGDWTPSKTKFPNGLTPLIEHVNRLGMDFGIWVEPEMVNEDSDLYRAHPDWVLRAEGKPITTWRNQYVLNFARDDVREFAWGWLDDLLANHNIAYLKWDMNRYLCEPGWPEKPLDEQREVWTRYVQNVHELYRRIQSKYPKMLLENCAGGGSRIDLAMAELSDLVNPSDNTDTLDNLKIFEGYTQLFLPKTENRHVSACPDGINGRTMPFSFRSHAFMMCSYGISMNLMGMSDAEMDELRRSIEEYKALRPLTQNGDLYRLVSIYGGEMGAYEFAAPDGSEAVVFTFGHSKQFMRPLPRMRLKGLIPDAMYSVDGGRPVSGRGLMGVGIEPELIGDYDSRVYRVRRI